MPSVRRLTATLAADVAGYSRLMGEEETLKRQSASPRARRIITRGLSAQLMGGSGP